MMWWVGGGGGDVTLCGFVSKYDADRAWIMWQITWLMPPSPARWLPNRSSPLINSRRTSPQTLVFSSHISIEVQNLTKFQSASVFTILFWKLRPELQQATNVWFYLFLHCRCNSSYFGIVNLRDLELWEIDIQTKNDQLFLVTWPCWTTQTFNLRSRL